MRERLLTLFKLPEKKDAIIINAAGYTHTSIAILDSLRAFTGLIYEVHISNIYNREAYRRKSYISLISDGVVCGSRFVRL